MPSDPVPPFVPPVGGNGFLPHDHAVTEGDDDADGERPLDPDADQDRVNSAAADEQAATEGTLDSGQET
jgi:hypothetical protein